MLPTYTQKKNGKRYHYYVPYLEKRQTAGASRIPGQRSMGPMPAAEIESAVLMQVLRVVAGARDDHRRVARSAGNAGATRTR